MTTLFSTKEVAEFLGVNEKMVYALISEKGLPASKITGKWIFPKHLVEQWVENNTLNFPEHPTKLPPYQGLLIIAGSNDLLLDKTISLFNERCPDQLAVFGNLGSMGGIRALRRSYCHIASSHLVEDNDTEYNFDFAGQELDRMPVVVNFSKREQGLLVSGGNPHKIKSLKDLGAGGIRIVNRPLGTGTRHLFDRELKKAGIEGESLEGYHNEAAKHLDVGIEILSGNADAGPGIKSVASLLGLDFIPLRWERYDLLIAKDRFFDKGVQYFIDLLRDPQFKQAAEKLDGYDIRSSGRMRYPEESNTSS